MLIVFTRRILGCSKGHAIRCIEHELAYLQSYDCEYEDIVSTEEFLAVADDDNVEEASKFTNREVPEKERQNKLQSQVLNSLETERNDDVEPEVLPPKGRGRGIGKPKAKPKPKPTRPPAPLPVGDEHFTEEYVTTLLPDG